MDIIIPSVDVSTTEEADQNDLPLASSYSKHAIVIQRRKINEIICSNMKLCNPFIELPFELFPQIEEEMEKRGWIKCGYKWYQPIWYISLTEVIELKDEADQIVSAKTFYDYTMINQLDVLRDKFKDARENGLAVILLDFPLYKVIVENLTHKGWEVIVHHVGAGGVVKPSTLIRVKQE